MRVLVDVSPAADGDYEVDVRLDSLAGQRLSKHSMRNPRRCESAELDELIGRVEADRLSAGDVKLLGRYLFDLLLRQDCWAKVVDEARERSTTTVELALRWDSAELALHRLSWEAMHDGTRFLGDHGTLSVAITRIVADAEAVECPVSAPAPARVLFAVGAPLNDPEIRSGAEIVGLLVGIEQRGSSIDSKIVDNVTLAALEEACAGFDPHIVHFVSHGRLNEGRGELQLAVEEEGESGWADGEKLLRAIGRGGSLPSMVLLTGCQSAAVGDHTDSLAVEMIKGGVPIAIGMAGKVADPVCRLFTRKYGMSISDGDRLVEAMTHGRRAGLQQQASPAGDDLGWALPSIYLAPCVPTDHAPVAVSEGSGIPARIAGYKTRRGPLFCGRKELCRQFENLLDPGKSLEVLVAYAEGGEKLGKTRLQYEFAAKALRAGHIVVIIDDEGDEPSRLPQNPVQLTVALLDAIIKARGQFRVPKLFESILLDELSSAVGRGPELESANPNARLTRLARFLGECRRTQADGEALADALGGALAADLDRLVTDVRGLDDETIDPESTAILILGGIGNWGPAADLLFERLAGNHGLSTPELRIPIFATCSFAEDARATVEAAWERSNGRDWEQWVELTPFDENEDMRIYQWVLLHPWSDHPWGDVVYAPSPEAGDRWCESFRDNFDGLPGDLDDPRFYLIASELRRHKVFVAADDDRILEEYARKG